jgi:orotate phosphoribosyltransferase
MTTVRTPLFDGRDRALATRIATTPGVVQRGVTIFDGTMRFPLKPLYLETAYGDPDLLGELARHGAIAADAVGADVVVGAESAGIPLATAIGMAAQLPSAFARKPGYRGHVTDEPGIRGADISGKRVLFVDDAIWRGDSLVGFAERIATAGGILVGAYCLVDMRPLAPDRWTGGGPLGSSVLFAPSSYDDILDAVVENDLLPRQLMTLVRSCITEQWADDDPRWTLLEAA